MVTSICTKGPPQHEISPSLSAFGGRSLGSLGITFSPMGGLIYHVGLSW